MSVDVPVPPNLDPPTGAERPAPGSDDARIKDEQELLAKIKKRYDAGVTDFEENKRLHSEDLNFVYNAETQGQWDPVVLQARQGKPCYTFNRVLGPVNMVVADMRQTRPAGKVRPENQAATEAVAEILAGICRDVEDASRAPVIYKTQYKFAVAGGFGAMCVMPTWASDDTFDQVLRIRDIPNPQTVVWDPECNDPCGGDAMWCQIGERISEEKHRALYPGKDFQSFDMSRDNMGWWIDNQVRVVDYFERVPYEKMIAQLSDGRVIDYDKAQAAVDEHLQAVGPAGSAAAKVVKTRKVLKWRVMWVKVNGSEILEGPIYYNWKRIPVVRIPGRYINIEGKKKFQSLIRHSKDAQRAYNSRASDMIERSALIPKAPYLATEAMISGFENEWAQANVESRPFLPFNVDPKAAQAGVTGGMPFRVPPIDMPQGAIALAQQAVADIQATTGFFDPALGNADDMNRVSGKALVQHTRRSDLGSYEFVDGFGAALQLLWEIMIDMIPTVYDTERVVRAVGVDEVAKLVTINQQTDTSQVMNDLKAGSYSCKVTLGPSYQSARQETLATLIDFASTMPTAAPLIADLIAKNVDTPDADEMARRLRIPLIKQGIVQPTEQEKASMPPPEPPNPMQQAEIERAVALADRDKSNAIVARHKVATLPLATHEKALKTAGVELTNILTAQKAGNEGLAARAEAEATAAENQQGLQQSATEHQQGLQQNDAEHQQGLRHAEQAHQQRMQQMRHAHELKMEQQRQQKELQQNGNAAG